MRVGAGAVWTRWGDACVAPGRPPHAPAPRPPSSSSCLGSACRLAGATQASPIGIKLRKTPASGSCHAAWTTPTPCQPASAAPDRGADPWDTADACPPAPVLPPVAALYWETACASQCDSPSAYCAGSL